MSANVTLSPPAAIVYPESDGLPVADNTKQLHWIVVLFGNLAALFRDRPDVFVAADLLWYPVEGEPQERVAPDVLVVLGRPPGDRGSYKQWEEDNVPLTVVFEILSPGNTDIEMDDKYLFYEDHGVQEYYVYDPDNNRLKVFVRQGEVFRRMRPVDDCVSPRLGIRFDLSGPEMIVWGPDGARFLTFPELQAARAEEKAARVKAETDRAEEKAARVKAETDRAEEKAARVKAETDRAEEKAARVKAETDRAEEKAARVRAEQRAARLAELSRKALRGQASGEELQELSRLVEEPPAPA